MYQGGLSIYAVAYLSHVPPWAVRTALSRAGVAPRKRPRLRGCAEHWANSSEVRARIRAAYESTRAVRSAAYLLGMSPCAVRHSLRLDGVEIGARGLEPSRIAEIRSRRAAGETMRQVAAAVGVGVETVRRWDDVPGRRCCGPRQVPPERAGEVQRLLAAGMSERAVARAVGVSRRTVRRLKGGPR